MASLSRVKISQKKIIPKVNGNPSKHTFHLQVICSTGYTVVVYLMTAQPSGIIRYILFLTICIMVSMVAQSIGLLIGVSMSIQVLLILLNVF
jgi:hypothetical protein